jgi:hypothetical protein
LLAQVCIHYSVLRRFADFACFDEDIEAYIYAKHVQLGLVNLYSADYSQHQHSCTAAIPIAIALWIGLAVRQHGRLLRFGQFQRELRVCESPGQCPDFGSPFLLDFAKASFHVQTSVIALPGLVVLGVTERDNGAVDVFCPNGEP